MNLCSFIVFLWFSFEFSVLEVLSNCGSLICTLKGRPGVKLGKHIWDLLTWAHRKMWWFISSQTQWVHHTHLHICLSHFSSQQLGLGLERGTYYVAQKWFSFGGGRGGLDVWEFCRLSLVPQKKKKKKKKAMQKICNFCQIKNSYQFVLLIVGLSWVMLLRGRFRFINWVNSENWPPWRVLKLTFQIFLTMC